MPSMGAVLHTLNIRLFPEQLAYVIDHAEDKVIIVDGSLIPLLARVFDGLKTVETVIVVGDGDTTPLGETLAYEELLAAEEPGFDWPELDERDAAAMCYTSGTTGNPKGVVYSHRSTVLHSMAATSAASIGMTESDRLLVIVPDVPRQRLGDAVRGVHGRHRPRRCPRCSCKGEALARIIAEQRSTLACGVPPSGTTSSGWPATARPVVAPARHRRRLRGATGVDRGLPGPGRRPADPGLGDDRDEPAGRPGHPAGRLSTGGGDRLPGRRPAGSCPASRCAWSPRTARSCQRRRVGGGVRGPRPVGDRLVLQGPRSRPGSTTAGCGPATSARSTAVASCRSPTAPRT